MLVKFHLAEKILLYLKIIAFTDNAISNKKWMMIMMIWKIRYPYGKVWD